MPDGNSSGVGMRDVIMISIALVILGVLMPLGLGTVGGANFINITVNGTSTPLTELVDPSVLTIFTIILPILAVIGVAINFIRKL